MATDATFKVSFRRRREGKTDYKKRLELVKSNCPRLIIRISNKYVLAQFAQFNSSGDRIIAQATSKELEKFGWTAAKRNLPAAFLTGLLAGCRAKKAGIEKAVLDLGLRTPVHGSRTFAALKGATDSGLKIPFEAKAFPSEERILGKHIEEFAKKLPEEEFQKKFSSYAQKKIDAKKTSALFENAKQNILKEVKK